VKAWAGLLATGAEVITWRLQWVTGARVPVSEVCLSLRSEVASRLYVGSVPIYSRTHTHWLYGQYGTDNRKSTTGPKANPPVTRRSH